MSESKRDSDAHYWTRQGSLSARASDANEDYRKIPHADLIRPGASGGVHVSRIAPIAGHSPLAIGCKLKPVQDLQPKSCPRPTMRTEYSRRGDDRTVLFATDCQAIT